jgi:hypothetical protein
VIFALARLPARRLLVARRAWIAFGAWALVTFGLAALRGHGASATDALIGIYASFTLPLSTLALTSAVARGDRLQSAARSLTRVGASGAQAALAHVMVAVVACMVAGIVLGVGVAVLAHGSADPSVGRDILTCTWVGALSGSAYGALFSLGSSFGAKGAGRGVVLLIDWVIGGGVLGTVLPHAHVRSLLGGDPAGGLAQRSSAIVLVVITIACALLTMYRSRRA